ncbi:hypothetical protein KI387_013806, partial [Taxus chinensis]
MKIFPHIYTAFVLLSYIVSAASATRQNLESFISVSSEIRQISATNPWDSYSVVDYGATGDGEKFDTPSIQAAIDACSSKGGGAGSIPAGIVFDGHAFPQDGGNLRRGKKGPQYLEAPFRGITPLRAAGGMLFWAEDASNVGVTGGGIIDGQSSKFVTRFDERKNVMVSWNATGDCLGDECRPRLLGFKDCRNVHVWNVHLTDPAYWCLHLVRSNNISIHDISIYGDFNTPNNDGIDIEDSNNTIITRCTINTGDDAICPKTYTGPLHNLTATDCWIRTKSSAIKLGSASLFNFEGLLFNNITVVDSHRGLALQIRDE